MMSVYTGIIFVPLESLLYYLHGTDVNEERNRLFC